MNKLIANTVFTIIAILIIVILGNLFFISNLDNEINKLNSELLINRNKLEQSQKELSDLPELNSKKNESTKMLISKGQESQLLRLILSSIPQKEFSINSYELFSSFFFKENSLNNENNTNNTPEINSVDKIPLLDDNGMPVTAYSQDDDEWQGIEITPVKITFSTEPKFLGIALKNLERLPLNAIRTADLIFDKKQIKGTIVFAFPLNEI